MSQTHAPDPTPPTHTLEYAAGKPSPHLPVIKLTILHAQANNPNVIHRFPQFHLDTADAYNLARQLLVLAAAATDRHHAAQVKALMAPAATDCDGRPTLPPQQGPAGGV